MLGISENAGVLRGTALEGLPIQEGPEGTVVVSGLDTDDTTGLLEAWRAAYALLAKTGRWPC